MATVDPNTTQRTSDNTTEDANNTTVIKSKLANVNDLQDYYDALNELEKQTGKLQAFTTDTESNNRDRWPTLFEILNKKTQSPLDLWSFYVYMRDEENSVDYIDFWIDTVQHINLCKVYVKGLRDSLAANSKIKQAEKVADLLSSKADSNNNNEQRSSTTNTNTNTNTNTVRAVPMDSVEPPQTRYSARNLSRNSNRTSQTTSNNSRTSSMLLDLLMKHDLLEGDDPHRLSTFLRGENSVRTSDVLINAKIDELKRKSRVFPSNTSINNQIGTTEDSKSNSSNFRTSKINPEMVETFIQDDFDTKHRTYDQTHLISRVSLRKSTRNILNTYFSENSEKRIDLPQDIVEKIKFELEAQGRDDPEVFDDAREYVFKAMEYKAYPNFLRNHALRNVTKKSAIVRLLLSMVCGFGAFWTGYTLIFINYEPKPTRAVVVIPFFFASYLFFTAFYRVDPFLCYAGYGESTATHGGIIPIREPYVKRLLRKRSLFVLIVLCLVAAAFSIIFALVPGKRLTRS